MADLIRKNSGPSKPGFGKIIAAILFVTAFFCLVYYLYSHSFLAAVSAFLSVFCGFSILITGRASKKESAEIKRYGEIGERAAGSVLERCLPDGYTVIQNAVIRYGGEKSEIDNIVVGKTGIFIVEVKNNKGIINGNYNWHDWIQDKTDRYDIEHEKTFYSPVKQVGTHIYRLANYLRDNKVFTHVYGAVYFVNRDAKIIINGKPNEIPVFSYRTTKELLDYIRSGEANLTDRTIQKILQLLN